MKVSNTEVLIASESGNIITKLDTWIAAGGNIVVPTNAKMGNARAGLVDDAKLTNLIIDLLKTKSGLGGCTVAMYDGAAHGHCMLDGVASSADGF